MRKRSFINYSYTREADDKEIAIMEEKCKARRSQRKERRASMLCTLIERYFAIRFFSARPSAFIHSIRHNHSIIFRLSFASIALSLVLKFSIFCPSDIFSISFVCRRIDSLFSLDLHPSFNLPKIVRQHRRFYDCKLLLPRPVIYFYILTLQICFFQSPIINHSSRHFL